MKHRILNILAAIFLIISASSCGVLKKKINIEKEHTTIDSVNRSTLDQTVDEFIKGDSIVEVPADSLLTKTTLKEEDTTTTQTVESGGMKLTITATKKNNGDVDIDVKAKSKSKKIKNNFTKKKKTTTLKRNNKRVRTETKTKDTIRDVKRDNRLTNVALIGGALIIMLFLGWYFLPKLKTLIKKTT